MVHPTWHLVVRNLDLRLLALSEPEIIMLMKLEHVNILNTVTHEYRKQVVSVCG